MAPSKSAMMAASLATATCPALAFQPSSSIRGAPADASQSTVQHHQASASSMDSEPMVVSGRMAASGVATLAAAAVLMAGARRTSKAPAKVQLQAFEGERGVQAPVGFWDPLGLAADGDVATFRRRRAVEIKHGRICMLACIGYIVPEYVKFPGYLAPSEGLKFADVPNGLGALAKVPAEGWLQIGLFLGHYEGYFFQQDKDRSPGDFEGYGFLGIGKNFIFDLPTPELSDADKEKKLSVEIANGRLAMVAIIGMFYQDGLTGSAWGDWSLYTDSPLRAFESELGAQPPLGFWDPLGLSADGDVDFFKRRREVEIKHGRVAMYAAMGYIVPEYFRFPGYLSPKLGLKFDDVPNGLAAFSKVPSVGWQQIVSFIGIYELFINKPVGDEPGNFGKGNLGIGLGKLDEATRARKLASELANGRLAMMAIIGMFFQDGLTGSAWGDWANYTDSPLRAFESELGAQAPLGFFDPLKLTGDGSVEAFKRRRQSEIKHGRISMLAAMGYMTPEITGKFPGYLSPSLGLKFADVPNGLAAVSKVPAAGWAQILGYMAYCETSQDQSAGTPGAAGEFGFKVITSDDDEVLKRKLASELANGRLAMMAIIGMFYQDGLTGSPWGDWSLYTDSPLRAFEGERGVQAPVGFWDPLGLAADGDVATFRRRRAVEIKHGRICMLACIGYIVPEYVKFPGYLAPSEGLKFADVPNGLGALAKVPAEGWLQIGLFLGHYEGYFFQQDKDRSPGDFEGYGFLGIGKNFIFDLPTPELSDADKEKKLSVEIANGRLAMVAIIGMFYQDGLTGSAWGDWSLYTDSPLRAFESELGAQPPLGFWDPLGFSADGDVYSFTRRRSVEIKHGRICMLATMGYMTPEITGKLPGYLSPSENVKFADVPNGLAAISKVPILGWCQIILYMAFCEINGGYDQDVQKGKPGDFGFKVITSSDPEALKRKLSAEIANGRLAMMAIMGMFFQDGLTGSAWGDWASYTDSPLRAFESELGAQPPLGFWDPLGLSADGDVDFFKRRREVEIKHGRVAMYAAMGYIVPEYFRFPGYLSPKLGLKFDDVPNGLAAFSKVPSVGWQQIVSFIGIYELFINKPVGDEPGNFGKGNLGIGLGKLDEATRARKLASELANGRLAMMAIIGMFFQDGLTGSAWGDWANYTDSPLRAFESELGAQAPLGFFDPLKLTGDGSVEAFKRRRQSEIKHGRISMLAAMGYMTPEITGKFPGYLSPSLGLKFADVPNGLAAVSKVPAAGWAQILGYMAYCETSQDQSAGTPGAAGEFGFKVITSDDDEVLKRKLASELANGRLAMMAIIGMFYQDGLTGSPWGDWSLYTDSPLRAFESERGAQPPFGFWDPLGLSADGDVATFKRRRASEIKHGRIAMLAAMGYMTPEITGKFPGYLSPSTGVKYADIPNGLAAISKVPFVGWLQILAWTAVCELWEDQVPGTPGHEGEFCFKAFKVTSDAPETRETKLASELANGRLAMMAIIGLFFQDGLTGSAYGDWANYTDSPLR
ncbi:Light-harvesting complex [Amphidinium carterae]